MKRVKALPIGQYEFGFVNAPRKPALRIAWPYRLRAGDIVYFNRRICPVLRVNDCAAVLEVARAAREFTTIFGKEVRLKPKPQLVRIASNSEIPILRRARKGGSL
jgi:hypothetical protein